ncbi:MAG: SPASM domain-containing protein [Eubacteriales bacterium]
MDYAIQTNGLSLDPGYFPFFKEHGFLVGLSLDLDKKYHDFNRIDSSGEGTFSRILATKRELEAHKVPYNVLCVLTSPLSKHPQKVWNFIQKEKLGFVQFIPCLGELEGNSTNLSLTSKGFSHFYSGLLPLWFDSLKKDNYISIRFFDDLFHLILHRNINSCGFTGQCGVQMVVEGDGSVYPCDFYVLDQWKLGNFAENSFQELKNCSVASDFLSSRPPLPSYCEDCPFLNFCNGGCKRMGHEMYAFGDFCGYRDFLERNRSLIDDITFYFQQRERARTR